MAERSKGKIKLNVIDPEAVLRGRGPRRPSSACSAVPLGADGESLYFGLAGTNSTDGREIIPFFQPKTRKQFLEYDVASLIHRLEQSEEADRRHALGAAGRRVVRPELRPHASEGWASIAQLRELVQLRTLAPDVANDRCGRRRAGARPSEGAAAEDAVRDRPVRHARRQADRVRRPAVRERSGRHSRADRWRWCRAPPRSARCSMPGASPSIPARCVGDRGLGLTVRCARASSPRSTSAIIGLNRDSMDAKDVVTSTLDSINVMTAGALKKKDGATIQFEPLLQSSTRRRSCCRSCGFAFLPDSRSRCSRASSRAASATRSPRACTAS